MDTVLRDEIRSIVIDLIDQYIESCDKKYNVWENTPRVSFDGDCIGIHFESFPDFPSAYITFDDDIDDKDDKEITFVVKSETTYNDIKAWLTVIFDTYECCVIDTLRYNED